MDEDTGMILLGMGILALIIGGYLAIDTAALKPYLDMISQPFAGTGITWGMLIALLVGAAALLEWGKK